MWSLSSKEVQQITLSHRSVWVSHAWPLPCQLVSWTSSFAERSVSLSLRRRSRCVYKASAGKCLITGQKMREKEKHILLNPRSHFQRVLWMKGSHDNNYWLRWNDTWKENVNNPTWFLYSTSADTIVVASLLVLKHV